jgi:hypothetical protein
MEGLMSEGELMIAIALPQALAEELQRRMVTIEQPPGIKVSAAATEQLVGNLGFELRKEAIAWVTITTIASSTGSVALNVLASYIYDYLRAAKPGTELLIRDARGGTLHLQQNEATNPKEIEGIVQAFAKPPAKGADARVHEPSKAKKK